MVAPGDDFPARQEHRPGRAAAVSSHPAQAAGALLEDRRASLALRSFAAGVFGIAFLWPSISDIAVIRLFAAYAFVDGVLALASGGWGASYRLGWPLLIGGCVGLVGAGAVYLSPAISLPMLIDVATLWAIGIGLAFTAAAATLRESDGDQLFLLSAIASLVFGRALLSQIPIDTIVLSAWLGLYTLTMAVLLLKLTLKHYRLMLL